MTNKEIEEKVRKDDRAKLIEMPEFQRLLFDIMEEAAITRFTREAQQSLFIEGKRALGLEVLGWFGKDLNPYDVIAQAIKAQTQFTRSEE